MAGHLVALEGLPGRYVEVSFDAARQMIVVDVSDAEGNLTGSMAWEYSEPVVTPDPAAPIEGGAE